MKKYSLMHKFADRMELQAENIPLQTLVEVCGYGRVLIENHRGIMAYSHEQIDIRARFGQTRLIGKNLRICQMSGCQLIVTGEIEQIHLIRG